MSAPEIKEKLTTLINNLEDEELLQEKYQMICEDSVPYGLSEVQKAQKEEIKKGLSRTHEEVKKGTAEWLKK